MLSTSETAHRTGVRAFLHRVHQRVRSAVTQQRFHPTQRALLSTTADRALASISRAPLSHPLSLIYLVARAHRCTNDDLMSRIGAFCLLYILSLDLFDDVQDEDLAGKPHEEAGSAIAINSAITLSFLATRELHALLPLVSTTQAQDILALSDEIAISAVEGQHRDLLGSGGALTPQDVLRMQQAKTSSVILLVACGALIGGCERALRADYRELGASLAELIQVRDDLRDVFGKSVSPDLTTEKMTYPLACFFETASAADRARFDMLLPQLPRAMKEMRTLLYDAGAVAASARAMEERRRTIIHHLATIPTSSPAFHRVLADVVDRLAGGVYPLPPNATASKLRMPGQGPYSVRVMTALDRLAERLSPLGLPADLPTLRPWHQPHWMYAPEQHTIYFPDIDELGEEILPFHAHLLGSKSLDEPRRQLTEQVPLVLAHEMFHFWRDAAGRLTRDHWHEEWAANRLSVAYALEFEPSAIEDALSLAQQIVGRFPEALGPHAERTLERCVRERPDVTGYGGNLTEVAAVSMELVRRIAARKPMLAPSVAELLGRAPIAASA